MNKQNMYDKTFSKIYEEYGWDYFSLTMGESIIKYFQKNNIKINTNLDLCCGTGVLCDYFYKQNIKTKGVDISSEMINIAKSKNKNIEFVCENVLDYRDSNTYDLITLTCDAINHLIGENELDKLFNNINNLTKDNGYLIFDILDPEKIVFNKEIVINRANDINVHYYITQNDNLINTNVQVKQKDELIYETNILEKMYTLEYIKTLLEKNGFEIIKAENSILDEVQRINNKIYVICKKDNKKIKLSDVDINNINPELIKNIFFNLKKEKYNYADYIIIYGCHIKELLDERLKHALDVINSHKYGKIVLTGGIGIKGTFNESEYMKKYLKDHSIDENKIIIENKSTTTEENNVNIMNMLNLKSIAKPTNIILISHEFHLSRIALHWSQIFNNDNIHFYFDYVENSVLSYDRIINDTKLLELIKAQLEKTQRFIKEDKYIDIYIENSNT